MKMDGRLAVFQYLLANKDKGLTSKEAFEKFGVTRLAAVIHDLRKDYIIDTVMQEGKTRYGKFSKYARYFYRGRIDCGNESTSN